MKSNGEGDVVARVNQVLRFSSAQAGRRQVFELLFATTCDYEFNDYYDNEANDNMCGEYTE